VFLRTFQNAVGDLCPINKSTYFTVFNPLKPNDPHRRRTAPLTSKVAFYMFIQQI